MSKSEKVLIENIHGEKRYLERAPKRFLSEEEVNAKRIKITPEFLKNCGAIEATKFHNMLETGQIKR